ncbi:30S ribosomal protein S3 [Candidatus Adlerbacteria bacterium RIFCSPLOWO2_01_FULL_51_16]|uniref:Small ribosomal subunit protein uS3 n=1 Tax=Candidatus Adlerbacteria bacterium RIFCSPLOWO2_01_FULL_51_16 TaxID=1797243 RepID=A0A1F4XHZ1_9BACT|nr:MAG: 30S ribosomal protein S3 [Candidatus Adlerbacteria bacterium RIFCSPLOWO2_01_FULL_51_16]
MSKVVNPFAHRLGIIRDWRHRWFAISPRYQEYLKADILLREFLVKELRGMYIGGIEFERNAKIIRVVIKTSRPGLIIGRSGEGSIKLKNKIVSFLKKKKLFVPEVKLDIEEIRSPESSAAIVAYMVAEGLEKRLPFRRVLKQTVEKVMANRDVKGVRVGLAGRLGGADMSRREELKKGRVPLQTFRSDIDFAREKAHLPYGDIGVKVWIYKGQIFAANAKDKKDK